MLSGNYMHLYILILSILSPFSSLILSLNKLFSVDTVVTVWINNELKTDLIINQKAKTHSI